MVEGHTVFRDTICSFHTVFANIYCRVLNEEAPRDFGELGRRAIYLLGIKRAQTHACGGLNGSQSLITLIYIVHLSVKLFSMIWLVKLFTWWHTGSHSCIDAHIRNYGISVNNIYFKRYIVHKQLNTYFS